MRFSSDFLFPLQGLPQATDDVGRPAKSDLSGVGFHIRGAGMNSRTIKAILAFIAIGTVQGCTATIASVMHEHQPVLVSLAVMEDEVPRTDLVVESSENPLCVSAGDGLGQSIWAWHLFVSAHPVEYLAVVESN